MPGRLEGKVAIITGGTSGIGRWTVEVFAYEGASVLIAARRDREGRKLADALGDQVDFLQTDVSLETDVKRMIDYTVERFGKLDCLFNNAASPAPRGGIATISMAAFTTGHFRQPILIETLERRCPIVYAPEYSPSDEKAHTMRDTLRRYRAIRNA